MLLIQVEAQSNKTLEVEIYVGLKKKKKHLLASTHIISKSLDDADVLIAGAIPRIMVGVTRHLTGDLVVMDVPHANRNYRTRYRYCNTHTKKNMLLNALFLLLIISSHFSQ